MCQSLRVELERPLPSQAPSGGRRGNSSGQILEQLRSKLFDLVIDAKQQIWFTREELLERLGRDWRARLTKHSEQTFPLPSLYEPIEETTRQLQVALRGLSGGYLLLVGSPGSGKSTLLTEQLRTSPDLAGLATAFRDRPETGPGRREAGQFLHDLVLELEARGLREGQSPPSFDAVHMAERFRAQLQQLADDRQGDRPAVILIDGLDHVGRPPIPAAPLLNYLPDPGAIPDGVLIVLGSQTDQILPPAIRSQLRAPERWIEIAPISRVGVHAFAKAAGLSEFGDELWKASGGHPLLLQLLAGHVAAASPDERAGAIAQFQPLAGDLQLLYDQIWASVEDDPGLVELLGLVCRIRGPIDLGWLEETGSSGQIVRQAGGAEAMVSSRDR